LPAPPPGLRYGVDLVDAEDEAALVREIARLELRPFEFHGYQGLRRIHSFGYRYDYSRRGVFAAESMPYFLQSLRREVAGFAACAPEDFAQALVSEYAPGAPIGWHRDKPEFGIVVGVSLLSACALRLRRRRSERQWDRCAIELQPRSAYLLSGESRSLWEHSIAPMAALRYSVTFRTLVLHEPRSPATPPTRLPAV
jgi:alkylated DNA repair dioxygenase AlkB